MSTSLARRDRQVEVMMQCWQVVVVGDESMTVRSTLGIAQSLCNTIEKMGIIKKHGNVHMV